MAEEKSKTPSSAPPRLPRRKDPSRSGDAGSIAGTRLGDSVALTRGKILNPARLNHRGAGRDGRPVLVMLAAGKGTRFGREPKCIQLLHGKPLARYSIDAFRGLGSKDVVCIVGYRYAEVSAALGADNLYVRSANATGGTAFAVFEAFSISDLEEYNPPLVICMGGPGRSGQHLPATSGNARLRRR